MRVTRSVCSVVGTGNLEGLHVEIRSMQLPQCTRCSVFLIQRSCVCCRALIFGAGSLVTVLIPTLHNYRLWSFIGLAATTYTTWFLVGSSVHHGQVRTPA